MGFLEMKIYFTTLFLTVSGVILFLIWRKRPIERIDIGTGFTVILLIPLVIFLMKIWGVGVEGNYSF